MLSYPAMMVPTSSPHNGMDQEPRNKPHNTEELLEKYGGVAFDYGALPKLVAVHSLTNNGVAYKTSSWETNVKTVHFPITGEEAPRMPSPVKNAFCGGSGNECRGALVPGMAVQPQIEVLFQQRNGFGAQVDTSWCQNMGMGHNVNEAVVRCSSQPYLPRATCHWTSIDGHTYNWNNPTVCSSPHSALGTGDLLLLARREAELPHPYHEKDAPSTHRKAPTGRSPAHKRITIAQQNAGTEVACPVNTKNTSTSEGEAVDREPSTAATRDVAIEQEKNAIEGHCSSHEEISNTEEKAATEAPCSARDKGEPKSQEKAPMEVHCPADTSQTAAKNVAAISEPRIPDDSADEVKEDPRKTSGQDLISTCDANLQNTAAKYGLVESNKRDERITVFHLKIKGFDVDLKVNRDNKINDPDNCKENSGDKRTISSCWGKEEASHGKYNQDSLSPEKSEKIRALWKQREDILQKMRYIMREGKRKVKTKTWRVPLLSELPEGSQGDYYSTGSREVCHSWNSYPPVTSHDGKPRVSSRKHEGISLPRRRAVKDGPPVTTPCEMKGKEAVADQSSPNHQLIANSNGASHVTYGKELLSPTKRKAVKVAPAVVPSTKPWEVNGKEVVAGSGPAVEKGGARTDDREEASVGVSLGSINTGQEPSEAAASSAPSRKCPDQAEEPTRKRPRKSVPRKVVRHLATWDCRELREQAHSSAEAARANISWCYQECDGTKQTTTDQTDSLLGPEGWIVRESCVSVGQNTNQQVLSCSVGSTSPTGCSTKSCILSDRKIAALGSCSSLGKGSELPEKTTRNVDGVAGSWDRQARIMDLLRKQERLMKQVQMTRMAREEVF